MLNRRSASRSLAIAALMGWLATGCIADENAAA